MTDDPDDTDDQYENYSLLRHPREPRALLLEGDAGWALPSHAETEPVAIAAEMRRQLGVDVTVLRCVYDRARDKPDARSHVYEIESHTAGWVPPPGARWVGREALRALPLSAPALRPVLEGWLDEVASGTTPSLRPRWARPGWWTEATAWIRAHAARLGLSCCGPIEQVKVCAWSTVLRIPTATGNLYLKAVAPAARFEPALTATIAALVPERSPRVLATDHERAWMLMADAGVPLRATIHTVEGQARWQACLAELAQLQSASAGAVERMLAVGCPDRRLERLPALYERLIADEVALMVGRPGGLTADELARARAMRPAVQALCEALARLPIPASIQHDDLGAGNVLVNERGATIFFDWSDSSISHPFLSCYIPLRWSRHLLGYDQVALERLRDSYLEPWLAYASRSQLHASFPLACRLAKLSRALTWRGFIAGMEPDARWEYEDSVPYFLRMFLNDDEGD